MYVAEDNMEKELQELPDGKKVCIVMAARYIIYRFILTLMFLGFSRKLWRLFHQDILNYPKVRLMGSAPLARLLQLSL